MVSARAPGGAARRPRLRAWAALRGGQRRSALFQLLCDPLGGRSRLGGLSRAAEQPNADDSPGDVGNLQGHDPHFCQQSFRLGSMRGALAVAARFSERPDENALKSTLESLLRDSAVACGEIWSAAGMGQRPLTEEERLRGGDRRIEACLMVETLRPQEAERVAGALSAQFPVATIGVYRLLCEISRSPDAVSTATRPEAPKP